MASNSNSKFHSATRPGSGDFDYHMITGLNFIGANSKRRGRIELVRVNGVPKIAIRRQFLGEKPGEVPIWLYTPGQSIYLNVDEYYSLMSEIWNFHDAIQGKTGSGSMAL